MTMLLSYQLNKIFDCYYLTIQHVVHFLAYLALYIAFLIFPFNSFAFELLDNLQVHGFASQAMFLTSGNNMFGPSISNPSFAFTELGINGSWSPIPNLRFSMQILSRRAGDWHNGTPVIDFGLMDYSFNFKEDYRIGFRAGRVRQPYGLYNDTRDVAFTRPSILLPQSIYFEGTRDYTISADGLLIYGESRKPWGNLTLELFGGYERTDDQDTQYSFLLEQLPGSLQPNPGFIGRLNYESYDGNLRLALSGAYTSMNYKSTHSLYEPSGGTIAFNPIVLSAQYNTEDWTFTSEYSPNYFNRSGLGINQIGINRDFNIFGQSYYFQTAYRFAPKWELMARYDAMYPNGNDENGNAFESNAIADVLQFAKSNSLDSSQTAFAVSQVPPAFTQFAKTWTVGIRYDISPSMMIRAEYDYINGTAWASNEANKDRTLRQYWDMFGFLVSLRF